MSARPKAVVIGFMMLVCLLMWGCMHATSPMHGLQDDNGLALASSGGLSGSDIDMLQKLDAAYERIAASVRPSVVNIQTTSVVQQSVSPMFNDPFFRQFFQNQMGQIPQSRAEHALGTGVVLTQNGYIVTNNHVIQKASDIKVLLPDNRQFKATLVGTDPQSDVAVIKIDASGLSTATLGDSSTVKVGDTVMAFGNPFGLNFTITRGSVSAVGRNGLNIENYEDFIQTDAAINPGNSGGALVNSRGQVIGINTAILSNGGMGGQGGFQGIGFAIPSNSVHSIMDSLVKTGKVVRGYLGVHLEPLDSELASQFKLPDVSGALVAQVEPGSPADHAGLKSGDVFRTFAGRTVDSAATLKYMVAGTPPGADVSVGIWRDGKLQNVTLKLGELPVKVKSTSPVPEGQGAAPVAPTAGALRGVAVQDLTAAVRQQLGVSADVQGVVVTSVQPDAPAGQFLQAGDLIMSINRQPVTSADGFAQMASQAHGQTLMQIVHQGNPMFVVVSPPQG